VYIRGNAGPRPRGCFSWRRADRLSRRVSFSMKRTERERWCSLLRRHVTLAGQSSRVCREHNHIRFSLSLHNALLVPFRCCHWEFTRSEIKWLMMGTKWCLDRVYVTLRLCRRHTAGLWIRKDTGLNVTRFPPFI